MVVFRLLLTFNWGTTMCKGKSHAAYLCRREEIIYSKTGPDVDEKICNECGIGFWPWKDKWDKARWCSKECQMKGMGKESSKKLHAKWNSIAIEKHAKEVIGPFLDKTGECWLFTGKGKSSRLPYGRINFRGKRWMAHKLSYRAYKDKITDGLLVLHTCDNPRCCNPEHLYLGTYLQNQHDKRERGKCKGEKLTPEQIKNIKQELKLHEKQKTRRGPYSLLQIGKRYGVTRTTIKQIKDGVTWNWITY